MSWITLSENHLKARLSRSELESYVEAGEQALAGEQVVERILEQVTSLVRGKVAANEDNLDKMGDAGTIPDECLFAACTIAREALVGSLPLSEGSTEVRKEELRKAYEYLDQVESGKVRIADSDGSIPEVVQTSTSYGGETKLNF